jgi:signal transduction histidine kinase
VASDRGPARTTVRPRSSAARRNGDGGVSLAGPEATRANAPTSSLVSGPRSAITVIDRLGSDFVGERWRALFATPTAQDILIASGLTAMSLVGVMAHLHVELPEGGGDVTMRTLDGLGVGLVLLQTVPLAWRRKAPVLVLSVITTAMFLHSLLGYFHSFAAFGFLVALYAVAAYRDRRTSIPAGIVGFMVILLMLMVGTEPIEPDAVFAELLVVGAAWFLGDGFRIRRGQLVQLEDRAAMLEREREERAQQAVAQERRVIARELHDVVAHNVSVIVAQAGAAQRVSATQPEEASAALGAIERIGREALVEMRRLMGILRKETDAVAARSPQPSMNNLKVLVAQVRKAGTPITLSIQGDPRPLSAGLDLSAFRIIQEALTNILKHAGHARAVVVVRYGESRLELSISDDGSDPTGRRISSPSENYGHLGMRERVALFGGDLRVGAKADGGYQVMASLPLDPEPV